MTTITDTKPRAAAQPRYRSWRHTDIAVLLGTFAALHATQVAASIISEDNRGPALAAGLLPDGLPAQLANLTVIAALITVTWWRHGRTRARRPRDLGLHITRHRGVLVVTAAAIAALAALRLWAGVGGAPPGAVGVPVIVNRHLLDGFDVAVALVTAAGLVPVAEELVFRAGIFAWARQTLHPITAGIASSMLFTALHPGAAYLDIALLAALMTWTYHRSGSLWPGIAIHAANNATILLAALAIS